jgi:polysaccharide biosynthesis transport protein
MNFHEPWQVLKRRWLPAAIATSTLLGVGSLYNSLQKPLYEAKGKITFKDQQSIFAGEGVNMNNSPNKIIRSLPVVKTALSKTESDRNANQVSDSITTSNVGNIIEIKYRDPNPQQAINIGQKLMEAYLEQDLNLRRQEAQSNRGQLEKQLPAVTNDLRVAEANLRKFLTDAKITDLTADKARLVNALNNLSQEVTTAKSQLTATQAVSEKLKNLFGQDTMTTIRSSLASNSPSMDRAMLALQGIEQQLAVERARTNNKSATDKSAAVQDLKSKQTVLRTAIQRESQQNLIGSALFRGKAVQWQQAGVPAEAISQLIQNETQRDSLEKSIAALNNVIDSGQKRLEEFPQIEEKMRLLSQDMSNANNNYEQLVAKLKASPADMLSPAKITSPANVSKKPIEIPFSIPPWLLAGLGLLTGGGLAFGLDFADKRLKNAATVQQIANYDMLGCIPQLNIAPKGQPQLIAKHNAAGEPFRMLHTNLKFLNDSSPAQVIVISSAVRGEGKTTVAANLAIATAQTGQRVLLIDADMREPQQHEFWKVNNAVGLSDVLQHNAQFAESVIEVAPNLELLPAGTLHPNPVSLFSSPAMVELIVQWFTLYDLVILDSSALTQAADTILLAKMADGLLLVVHPQVAEVADLKHAQDLLNRSQQRVLGMVLNGVKAHEHYEFAPIVEQPAVEAATTDKTLQLPPMVDANDVFVPKPDTGD